MYYAEEVINGVLCFKNHPNDDWTQFSQQQLTEKITELTNRARGKNKET